MSFKNHLSLIDLISEQHSSLRREAESRWRAQSPIEFSHTEWFLLSRTELESLSISKAAHIIGISRQAMQKCAKKLESRGYIKFVFNNGNKRDKFLVLTDAGKECTGKNNLLKKRLEKEIIDKLGKETVEDMIDLLKTEWIHTE